MLRICLRPLCRPPVFQAGESVGGCLTNSLHCDGKTAPLERLLAPFIPVTFTALTQISRSVDAELMERVAEAGGLRSFLGRHSDLFAVSKVGGVYVARRLRRRCVGSIPSEGEGLRLSCEAHGPKPEQQVEDAGVFPRIQNVPLEVFRLFPTFFVPMEALLAHLCKLPLTTLSNSRGEEELVSEDHSGRSPEAVAESLVEKYNKFLEVVSLNENNGNGEKEQLKKFVRLQSKFATRAASYEEKEMEVTGGREGCISQIMEPYKVEEYEQYRVARLIPVAEEFCSISAEMQQAAAVLLPEGRSLIHVLLSAPDLFEVRDTPELTVRFILDSRFRPTTTCTKEEIERKLTELKESRVKNGLKMPIDRKKRRTLSRQLQFFVKPTPYLDERVWAYALLDTLPLDGPVAFAVAMSNLPSECLACTPVNLQRLISQYSYLFSLVEGEREKLLQRADIPAVEQRSVSSIDTEEILLTIYNYYPRRRHPNCGTCLERCIYSMPLLLRTRLRQLDFVEDVLRKHPDKVEVLGMLDEELMMHDRNLAEKSQMCQVFRFVGEYQAELIKRYEALCAKLGKDPNTKRLV
ncbi:hypothetical protein TCDM_13762 [Trypanosoma cruzi Dm28c]|uniref:Uncharacterized protein n=2 Tax=Trypanosoma cruzi TaxID=5693 RepID=V5BY91_TRYCR|nr:hypothetical protein TCDM_13762 [Trypanosoma cruzi Dm28c]PBJ73238.1 hypothetical protein BCY84_14109 [Trypanosoma cruzi cruzi]PWV02471.1 hypothetical protein C4B63_2g742 [Trypanosoma cruzi]